MTMHGPCPPTQSTFRTLVEAMSHPGQNYPLPVDDSTPAEGPPALFSICSALLDHEVSYCVLGRDNHVLDGNIFSLTKARRTSIRNADYVIVPASSSDGQIAEAKRGKPDYPDTGATIIYLLEETDRKSSNHDIALRGPGIDGTIRPDINSLDPQELKLIQKCNADYPQGIDCIFLNNSDQLMCLPRTTHIEVN